MASNITTKKVHVSPGIYFTESELSVATKSLGITHLGVVGETLRGPAFQPIDISSWSQFQNYFGGTSTEKFRGSQYPKYELPYIAKTYLEQSQNLKVCRVLGLSGVNAGPAWIITAWSNKEGATYTETSPMVVAIIRSRGEHKKMSYVKAADPTHGICDPVYKYDGITYYAKNVKLVKSKALTLNDGCDPGFNTVTKEMNINVNNYGVFGLEVETIGGTTKTYSVSFNPTDKNYIYNVIGGEPEVGESEIYVEELYDVALKQLIEAGELNTLGGERVLEDHGTINYIPSHEACDDLLIEEDGEKLLKKSDVGKRFLCTGEASGNVNVHVYQAPKNEKANLDNAQIKFNSAKEAKDNAVAVLEQSTVKKNLDDAQNKYNESAEKTAVDEAKTKLDAAEEALEKAQKAYDAAVAAGDGWVSSKAQKGHIYTVVAYTTTEGKREYYYGEYEEDVEELKNPFGDDETNTTNVVECVYVNAEGHYYYYPTYGSTRPGDVVAVTLDFNNYKEQYRYSSTPWIVSEIKGSANNVELAKLFRFHTISDGNDSATEIKISIENIDPTNGTFDVLVRDFSDIDSTAVVLERYKNCDLVPGSSNYIALKIGSIDETYEIKSKYITVEVNENETTKSSIPAGFLGYPVRDYSGTNYQKPYLQYNTNVDEDIRIKKQYFGMSNLVGIDTDVLKYKGVEAYNGDVDGLTPGFHLDSRILAGKADKDGVVTKYGIKQTVSVDGVKGYEWVSVGISNTVGNYGEEPRIGTEDVMTNTIYEDKRYRKFTLCFYGGFDGWDYYRTSRSNGDDFKYQKYRGDIDSTSGEGENFSIIAEPETFNFDRADKIITSDYYAYLSAIREFANPKETDINVFATPGIDYVNQNLLVQEAIEMIEEERADSIYVITTPDKPFGAGDSKSEMYTAEEAVDNLEASDIDSNWCCTYFPWIKYYDSTNSQYIYLPPTRDVVKNMAYTDNTSNAWFAPAGWNRGLTDGIHSRKNLLLSEQDELYGNRINFINNFADEGMRIWGNNNLQIAESNAHMNKISTRRCLIRLRKLISVACIGLLFEPNDPTTVASFRSAVQPILESFIAKRALADAKLVVDDSTESLDRLEINAQLYLKFVPSLEYINIGIVATPSGVSFDDI